MTRTDDDGTPDGSGSPRRKRKRKRTAGLRLSDALRSRRFVACDEVLALGCHDDPMACGPGDVFVARSDRERDGHELVSEAVARGCSGVVAERMVPTYGAPLCLVPDAAAAYASIVHQLAGRPASSLEVIAVTGTSGKTTTAWLSAAVLAEAGYRVGVLSDLGCLDAGSIEAEAAPRLEDPHVLCGWLNRLVASGCTHAIIETSSRMLAARTLADIDCGTVAITNLATAHLDMHGSVAAYHAIKRRILESLAINGCLVGNADDPGVARAARRHVGRRLMTGLRTSAELTASPVERSLDGQTFLLQSGNEMMPVAVSTPVASYARNALMAAAIGMAHGVPLTTIARGLEAVGSVSGRLERMDRGQDFAAFADQPTSGHQLGSTLASLRHLTGQKRLVAVMDVEAAERLGGDGGRRRCATRMLRWCDDCILVPARLGGETAASSTRFLGSFDRILSQLGRGDCLIVVGDPSWQTDPIDPDGERMSARMLTEGWFRVACPPEWDSSGKHAA